LQESETRLVKAFNQVGETHPDTPDVVTECRMFAQWADEAAASLAPFVAKYGERIEGEPERLDKALLVQRRQTGFDLLRDMHDLFLLTNESLISATVLHQAALGLRDRDLRDAVEQIRSHNDRMREWLFARCRQAAPQILIVAS
jgi:ferredoxin-nitrate reductase